MKTAEETRLLMLEKRDQDGRPELEPKRTPEEEQAAAEFVDKLVDEFRLTPLDA